MGYIECDKVKLRDDFRPDSDIDVLVDFDHSVPIGLMEVAGMEIELSKMLGRKADIRTPGDLSQYFREKVVAQAEVQYEKIYPILYLID